MSRGSARPSAAVSKKTSTRPYRGRPRRPRRDGRPPLSAQDILRVALRRFAASGYATTSVRQIAEELGVFPASIYNHFASKEAMLDACFSAGILRAEADYFTEVAGLGLPPDVALYKLVYEEVLLVSSGSLKQRFFLLPEIREKPLPGVTALWDEICGTYEEVIKAGIEEGAFVDVPSRVTAEHFFSLTLTVLASFRPEGLGAAPEQATAAADLALRSLLVRPSRLNTIRRRAAKLELTPRNQA